MIQQNGSGNNAPPQRVSAGKVGAIAAAVIVVIGLVGGGLVLHHNQQERERELQAERDEARLAAEQAQKDAEAAQAEREQAQKAAEAAQAGQEKAQKDAEQAQKDAEQAQRNAEQAQRDAQQAQRAAEHAIAQAGTVQRQTTVSSPQTTVDSYWDRAYAVDYTARVISPDGIGVNLRSGPDSSYAKARTDPVPVGAVVTITYETTSIKGSKWGYTTYDGITGWVYLDELKAE